MHRFGPCISFVTAVLPFRSGAIVHPHDAHQVASQQGVYLARLFSRGFEFSAIVPQKSGGSSDDATGDGASSSVAASGGSSDPDKDGADGKVPLSEKLGLSVVKGKFAKPFQFLNLGILAYTGAGGALAQVQVRGEKCEGCFHPSYRSHKAREGSVLTHFLLACLPSASTTNCGKEFW